MGGPLRRSALVVPVAAVAATTLAAAALVPAWRDERRLAAATTASPATALSRAVAAQTPATLARAREIEVTALVRLGRLRDAERLARAEARRRPGDAMALRRLYEVQRLRGRGRASAATLRALEPLDPLFAAGTGG